MTREQFWRLPAADREIYLHTMLGEALGLTHTPERDQDDEWEEKRKKLVEFWVLSEP